MFVLGFGIGFVVCLLVIGVLALCINSSKISQEEEKWNIDFTKGRDDNSDSREAGN
jgi:hypothetical protein